MQEKRSAQVWVLFMSLVYSGLPAHVKGHQPLGRLATPPEPLSVTLSVGFLLVGAIRQRVPVGVSAERIELEDPNVNLPEAIVLASYCYPLLVELRVEVERLVHESSIHRIGRLMELW